MRTLISTKMLHPRDRFVFWHRAICAALVNHDSQPVCPSKFQAELRICGLAEIDVFLNENSPIQMVHTHRQAADSDDTHVLILRQLCGTFALEHNGFESLLELGDTLLLDPTLPFSGNYPSNSQQLILKVSRNTLKARIGKTQLVTGRLIKPLAAESKLASAFLGMLPTHVENLSQGAQEIVSNQVLDLFAMSLAPEGNRSRTRLSSVRSTALMNIRAAIDARLTDPKLDAPGVASAAGISVRYANLLLAQEDTSIARLIQSRRLACCRRALEDPGQRGRSISEIAYGWGFSDMTHFGRRFKAAYGLLPRDYRRLANPS